MEGVGVGSVLDVGWRMCVGFGWRSVLGGCGAGLEFRIRRGGARRLGIGGAYLLGGLRVVSSLGGEVL